MRIIARSLAGTVAGILLAGSVAAAADTGRCSHDGWIVDGQALSATLCVPLEASAEVPVTATYARAGATISRTVTLDPEAGAQATRAIDTVPLDGIGSAMRLHVTIVYRNRLASIEHAILLPGAVVLK